MKPCIIAEARVRLVGKPIAFFELDDVMPAVALKGSRRSAQADYVARHAFDRRNRVGRDAAGPKFGKRPGLSLPRQAAQSRLRSKSA